MKYKIIIFLIILTTTTVAAQVDSALVRIRTDIDSSLIQLNNQVIIEDSYGNPLIKNYWFIINLPIETYNIKITAGNYNPIDSTITLVKGEIYTFDVQFTEIKNEDTIIYFEELPEAVEVVKLVVQSEPDSCSLVIGQETIEKHTPIDLFFKPGEYLFRVSKEGYDPLKSRIKIELEVPILANFKLKSLKPNQVLPESLGISYMTQMPLLNVKQAEKIKVRYNSLAESFAIFPMAQGILARLVVDKSHRRTAEVMILSGVGLTLGSYLLGKILYKKKRQFILDENIRREVDNGMVDSNNKKVDQMINEVNTSRMKEWLRNNRNRGEVIIKNINEIQ